MSKHWNGPPGEGGPLEVADVTADPDNSPPARHLQAYPRPLAEAARALAEALRDGGAGETHRAVAVWREVLDPAHRLQAALLALATLEPPDLRALVADLTRYAGEPLPPFDGLDDEAALWARLASVAELRVYLAVIWRALLAGSRRSFVAWSSRAAT